jgi:hypothetical protein
MKLSRIDPETGYDDFDQRDEPEPDEEPDIERVTRRGTYFAVTPMPIMNVVQTQKKTA